MGKEFKADSGKVYYYNDVTKESVWTLPKELMELKEQIKKIEESQQKNIDQNQEAVIVSIDSGEQQQQPPPPLAGRVIGDSFRNRGSNTIMSPNGVMDQLVLQQQMIIQQQVAMIEQHEKK